uniref:Uncharacterized protein n=1 Tax=Trichogramma kaykai TaxID=54128 RepID=A0ABD2X4T5_9HYME
MALFPKFQSSLAGSHPTFCEAAMHPHRAAAAHAALCRKDLHSTEAPRSSCTIDFASQGGNNRGSSRRHQTKTYGIEMQRRLFRAYTHIYASESTTMRRRYIKANS